MTTSFNKPDLILYNGVFKTQDFSNPFVQAVAIKNGRILNTGENGEIQLLAGPRTHSIDLEGRLGLPGMIDSHFHFFEWALFKLGLDLKTANSIQEIKKQIKDRIDELSSGDWLYGYGWSENDWPEHRMLNRKDLDEVAPDYPVILWRNDLHCAAVNSKALEIAGIDKSTEDPEYGIISRDDTGKPDGILKEYAINLVKRHISYPSNNHILDSMKSGISFLHSVGLTSIHDIHLMGGLLGADAMKFWHQLWAIGRLNVRCWISIPGEHLDEAISLGLQSGFGNDRVRIGHLKYFADGSMGARTAWMYQPYSDADRGMQMVSMDEMQVVFQKADEAGLSVMVHAIGDRSNGELIRCLEKVQLNRKKQLSGKSWDTPLPHRIEHLQMIHPQDIHRLAKLDIVVSMQPVHLLDDMYMIDSAIGERGQHCYPFNDLVKARVPIIFGSDHPVADPRPIAGIHAAVNRKTPDGIPKKGWYSEQRISVDEAVRCYTLIPAIVSGSATQLGSISPGKIADIIILDQDIYSIPPEEIIHTQVDTTVFDGQIVYQR